MRKHDDLDSQDSLRRQASHIVFMQESRGYIISPADTIAFNLQLLPRFPTRCLLLAVFCSHPFVPQVLVPIPTVTLFVCIVIHRKVLHFNFPRPLQHSFLCVLLQYLLDRQSSRTPAVERLGDRLQPVSKRQPPSHPSLPIFKHSPGLIQTTEGGRLHMKDIGW